jgi:GNAT superfamily N-acetyltransferase
VASLDLIRYRTATPRDAVAAVTVISEGFGTYREFAPAGWQPPSPLHEEGELHERLSRGDVHARLALADNLVVGFTSWSPALTRTEPREPIPGRSHLGALFVTRAYWGTGLASSLLSWSTDGMRDSGFECGQLYTPRDQARARAFYEREGWTLAPDGAMFSPELDLDLVMYERPLTS